MSRKRKSKRGADVSSASPRHSAAAAARTDETSAPLWRRRLIIAAIAIAIVAGGAFLFRHLRSASPTGVRDVILITIDTARADAFGFAGNGNVQTPFLDSLAAKGIVYTNAHAHNVVTLPSHVNILTGLNPYQHGVRENAGFTLDAAHPTIATTLRNAGFATGAFVAAFPLDARFGLNQGFDTYDDNYGKGRATLSFVVQERSAEATLTPAIQWWRANDGRKRFLWVHVYDPHAPYAPPEPFASQYRQNPYLGEVAYVDSALQSALEPILSTNPDALVIVTSDHGEALGEHGEKTHGLFAYESTLKVPLLIAGAGLAARREEGSVRHIDIAPTILAATGTTPPSELPGVSLFEPADARDTYFESLSASLNRGWAPLTGIIHDGMKYISLPIPELYDLENDPREMTNLHDTRRRDAEKARKLLEPMLKSSVTASRNISSEEAARLRSLGYVAGSTVPKSSYAIGDDPKRLIRLDTKMHEAIDAYERGQRERALVLAREVVAERPQMNAGRELLAFMLDRNSRVIEAIEQLRIIVSDPNASDANRTQLALLYSETGDAASAIELLAPRAAASSDPDLLNAYGVALSDAGRHEEASKQFERVLARDPNNAPALQNLGILAMRRGDVRAAETHLTRALALNPRLPLALNTLGVVQARKNDFAGAVDSWNRAVAIDPRQYDALYNIGLVAARMGDRDQARQALTRFVETAPKHIYAPDIAAARKALASLE